MSDVLAGDDKFRPAGTLTLAKSIAGIGRDMGIDRKTLDAAVDQNVITSTQAKALWQMATSEPHTARFTFNHVLYYLGGLVAIGGATIFVNVAWDQLGGWGVFAIAVAGIGITLGLTHYFLDTQDLPIPAGLLAALAVALVPLAVFGLQRAFGFWPEQTSYHAYHVKIDWRWIFMELSTLVAGALVLWRFRLPFSVMPVAVTLWYMSMDLAPLLQSLVSGMKPDASLPQQQQWAFHQQVWKIKQWTSVIVGLVITCCALVVDLRTRSRKDYAFWLYLAGTTAFWGGLTSMDSANELGKFIYFLINLAMIFIGAAISRRVFTVFGAIGVAMYLGYLAHKVFKDSLLFPIVLTGIGLAVVCLGVLWQRHEVAITAELRRFLPEGLRRLNER